MLGEKPGRASFAISSTAKSANMNLPIYIIYTRLTNITSDITSDITHYKVLSCDVRCWGGIGVCCVRVINMRDRLEWSITNI